MNKTQKLVKKLYKENGKPVELTDSQAKIFDLIWKKKHSRNHIQCFTRFGKSFTVALAVLTRAATFAEKWAIVAPSEKKAKIIMSYVIEHIFDNNYTKSKLEYDKKESLERMRRERSKNKINFLHSDNTLGEIFVLSADSRTKSKAGDSLMGFGCIPEKYRIRTDKGDIDIKKIVKNKKDYKILSYNHKTKKKEYKEILEYQENLLADRYLIEFDLGDRKFKCTNDHPIFIENKGYVRADKVKKGDVLMVDE